MLISILCLSALASLFCPLSLPVQAACLPKTVPGSSSGSDESRPPGFTLIFPLLKFILGWSEKYVWCGLLASKSFFSSFSLFSVFFFFKPFHSFLWSKRNSPLVLTSPTSQQHWSQINEMVYRHLLCSSGCQTRRRHGSHPWFVFKDSSHFSFSSYVFFFF